MFVECRLHKAAIGEIAIPTIKLSIFDKRSDNKLATYCDSKPIAIQ